ncbi:MAG: hypothetical protein ABL962_13140 [Fimbriimonadaceae bacterium]
MKRRTLWFIGLALLVACVGMLILGAPEPPFDFLKNAKVIQVGEGPRGSPRIATTYALTEPADRVYSAAKHELDDFLYGGGYGPGGGKTKGWATAGGDVMIMKWTKGSKAWWLTQGPSRSRPIAL